MGLQTALASLVDVGTMLGARVGCADVTSVGRAGTRRVILGRL